MENSVTLHIPASAELRELFDKHLNNMFISNEIKRYLSINGSETEQQLLNFCDNKELAPSHIKFAFAVWLEMDMADRHAILAKFDHLFKDLPITNQNQRKILIFCTLFIHEFASVLAEAIAWPD
ncbi:MAG TPA: hypothetical protein VHA56_07750 [Mucilaginibacter sp.]|nr:hypothetical protein [Mucilaginibacter sp.]